jgi:hypothetical protein
MEKSLESLKSFYYYEKFGTNGWSKFSIISPSTSYNLNGLAK